MFDRYYISQTQHADCLFKNPMELEKENENCYPPFRYHMRMALLFVPGWIIILSMGDRLMLIITITTAIIGLVLHMSKLYTQSLVVILGGAIALGILQILHTSDSIFYSISRTALAINCSLHIAFTFLWILLLFPSIHIGNFTSSVPRTAEQILFALAPIPAVAIYTWTVTVRVGIENSAYWLMVFLMIVHVNFWFPTPSSYSSKYYFKKRDSLIGSGLFEDLKLKFNVAGISTKNFACPDNTSKLHFVYLILMPALLYISNYWQSLALYGLFEQNHITNIGLLLSVPLLYIGILGSLRRTSPLWWLNLSPEPLENLHRAIIFFSSLVVLLCVEHNVLFAKYSHLIVGVNPPYSYIVVTVALILAFLAVALYLNSSNRTGLRCRILPCTLGAMTAIGFSIAFGLPIVFYPIPIAAIASFLFFCFGYELWAYLVFVFCTQTALTWFFYKTFWFLSYEFSALRGYVSLRLISVAVLAASVISSIISGMNLSKNLSTKSGIPLLLQAIIIAALEEILYAEKLNQSDDNIYPFYLVILTTVCGICIIKKLVSESKISPDLSLLISVIYTSKIFLLLKPVNYSTLSGVLLLTPPVYSIYKAKSHDVHASRLLSTPSVSMIYVACVTISVYLTRWTVQSRVLGLLTYAYDGTASTSSVLVNGLAILICGTFLSPLVWCHPYYRENRELQMKRWINRIGLLFMSIGSLLMVLDQIMSRSSLHATLAGPFSFMISNTEISILSIASFLGTICIATGAAGGLLSMDRVVTRSAMSLLLGTAIGSLFVPFMAQNSALDVKDSFLIVALRNAHLTISICSYAQAVSFFLHFACWKQCPRGILKILPVIWALSWIEWPLIKFVVFTWNRLFDVRVPDEMEKSSLTFVALKCLSSAIVALFLKIRRPNNFEVEPSGSPAWSANIGNFEALMAFILGCIVNFYLEANETGTVFISLILLTLQTGSVFRIPKMSNPCFLDDGAEISSPFVAYYASAKHLGRCFEHPHNDKNTCLFRIGMLLCFPAVGFQSLMPSPAQQTFNVLLDTEPTSNN
ncbi:uncharacterized protein LOC126318275 isoform X2 [Schistocerca gregaria]|uniref:uncharacterized protein LOC126318275 isoform X2 n=1 Tax=Schistocerca gregaria TaxID=7010 RepID=UPI00211DAB55|nr:uncharacterized protein LOC126318275 isoform X2 [Schistocerca gregaria]